MKLNRLTYFCVAGALVLLMALPETSNAGFRLFGSRGSSGSSGGSWGSSGGSSGSSGGSWGSSGSSGSWGSSGGRRSRRSYRRARSSSGSSGSYGSSGSSGGSSGSSGGTTYYYSSHGSSGSSGHTYTTTTYSTPSYTVPSTTYTVPATPSNSHVAPMNSAPPMKKESDYNNDAPPNPPGAKVNMTYYSAPKTSRARLHFNVPTEAVVYLMGQKMSLTGNRRVYRSPELKTGVTYEYDIRVELTRNGQQVTKTHQFDVAAGKNINLTFVEYDGQLAILGLNKQNHLVAAN